jgi:hypothetical protein
MLLLCLFHVINAYHVAVHEEQVMCSLVVEAARYRQFASDWLGLWLMIIHNCGIQIISERQKHIRRNYVI